MSKRTFARRFRDEVGMSPGRWLIQQRIFRARQLLELTDMTVDRIAGEVGFATLSIWWKRAGRPRSLIRK